MDEEVNWDKNGEADGMNLEVDSKDRVNKRSVIFKEEMVSSYTARNLHCIRQQQLQLSAMGTEGPGSHQTLPL